MVRKMHPSNLDVVSDLAMLANPHAVKEKYKKLILDELKENPDLSFVATIGGDVVGYVLADIHDGRATLEDIAVSEKFQGKGIGKRLLDKELIALKDKQVKIVRAEVHYKCASAIPFYYKHNFRITGFAHDYFGKNHDAIILQLVLQ
jgi:ribosomal protein S18 acetylase RimI-like enzyme